MQEILSTLQIKRKTERLAHELIENCFNQERILIAGIAGNGEIVAQRIGKIVREHLPDVNVDVFTLTVNKDKPWSEAIGVGIDTKELENSFIILVDDVVNSGKTMQYALVELLGFPTKAIKTLVLVDRKHRRFPIKADFVGLSLSTTLKERVEVDMTEGKEKAYLV